jgi:hypothetical protein
VQKLRCDEVELFTPEVWEAAQLTTQSKVCGGVPVRGAVEALSTMHRPYGQMSALVEEARAGRRRLFRWGVTEVLELCPTESDCERCSLLPECGRTAKPPRNERTIGFLRIADVRAMKGRVDESVWNAEMLCRAVSRSDRVLPQFDEAVHLFDSEPFDRATVIAGMDFGFRAPTVVLWGLVDRTGTLRIVAEHVRSGLVIGEHIQAISASPWGRPLWIGVDPSGANPGVHGEGAIDALKKAGLAVRTRPMQITPGLNLIRARLHAADGSPPRLLIHRRCRHLIESLTKYHYNPGNPQSEDPVKDGPDHAVDALRYLIVNLDRPGSLKVNNYAA